MNEFAGIFNKYSCLVFLLFNIKLQLLFRKSGLGFAQYKLETEFKLANVQHEDMVQPFVTAHLICPRSAF